jgi:hypothetical protein
MLEAPLFSPLGQKRLDKKPAIGSCFLLQNSNIRDPALFDRRKTLMHRLTDHTILSDLLDPVSRALARVRQAAVVPALVQEARPVLPDQLAGIPGLGDHPVRAIDGTYQAESAHCHYSFGLTARTQRLSPAGQRQ